MFDTDIFHSARLCVVGNLNRDIKIAGLAASPGLFEDGETSVGPIVETIGGGGANSACAAAGLGAQSVFAGKVGDDALGRTLAVALERHGVQARLARDKSCPTGSTVALGFENGCRHFVSCLPNNESLRYEDIDLSAMDGCTHLLRADVWFSEAMLEGGNERLLTEARRRSIATSVDINWDPQWTAGPSDAVAIRKDLLRKLLPLVDVAHGNVRELCRFADCDDLNRALVRICDWGAKAVVVHMGKQGAGYYAQGRLIVEPPVLARHTVHATGTGDVLSVCMMLLHHRRDMTIDQKLHLANQVVTRFMEGELPLIPTL